MSHLDELQDLESFHGQGSKPVRGLAATIVEYATGRPARHATGRAPNFGKAMQAPDHEAARRPLARHLGRAGHLDGAGARGFTADRRGPRKEDPVRVEVRSIGRGQVAGVRATSLGRGAERPAPKELDAPDTAADAVSRTLLGFSPMDRQGMPCERSLDDVRWVAVEPGGAT